MSIPPKLIEPLSIVVARVFAVVDLQGIMLKTTGEGLFEVWTGRNLPDRETALELLQKVSERDVELVVLVEMLARRPNDAELGRLIDQACPDARKRLPTTDEHVAQLLSGLAAVRASLDNQAVKDAVNGSRVTLETIVATVDSLDVYKNLHECLHQLQAKQFHSLRSAAKTMPDKREQARELKEYRQQLRIACLFARGAVEKLPDVPIVRQTELLWIGELELAGDRFHEAIENRNAKAAQSALKDIRIVMRGTPPRLNDLIFSIATLLPLDALAQALGKIVETGGGAASEAGLHSLQLIIPAIRARVVDHKGWQAADIRISDLDQLIDHQPRDLFEEFADDWMELKGRVRALTALDPDAPWAKHIDTYAADVDHCLFKEVADEDLTDAFASFRGDAQYRFLLVDSKLKSDCGSLVKISTPLHEILREVGQ